MPPRTKITKEMIVAAAYDLVRTEGIGKLTARSVADKLGCSTQPVLYNYATIDDIKKEAYEKADMYHSEYIMPKGRAGMNPLLELGLNYVRFGYEEKMLLQFLFQTDQFSGMTLSGLVENPLLGQILELVSKGAGISIEEAKEMFLSIFITAHGCASLLAGNAMEYEEERIISILTNSMKRAK